MVWTSSLGRDRDLYENQKTNEQAKETVFSILPRSRI
jgi:hypothetical protein